MAQYQIDNIAAPIDFETKDPAAIAVQRAKNLLMCRMGEVPYDRYRGFDAGIFELPSAEFMEELLPELDRIMMWEPNAEVADAEAGPLSNGQAYIRVILEIKEGE